MTYNDITYCSRECANMECKRNQKHIPKDWEIVSMAGFADCENWKEVNADFMFKELGYKKAEIISNGAEVWIEYWKDSRNVFHFKDGELFQKEVSKCGSDDAMCDGITMAELKAINKKCQELDWE